MLRKVSAFRPLILKKNHLNTVQMRTVCGFFPCEFVRCTLYGSCEAALSPLPFLGVSSLMNWPRFSARPFFSPEREGLCRRLAAQGFNTKTTKTHQDHQEHEGARCGVPAGAFLMQV
jgi:hypothetical protein